MPMDPDADPDGAQRRRSIYRTRTLVLAAVVVAIWVGLLADPWVGPILLTVAAGLGLTLGVVLVAVALGWLGFGLFAIGGRLAGWVKRASTWPD